MNVCDSQLALVFRMLLRTHVDRTMWDVMYECYPQWRHELELLLQPIHGSEWPRQLSVVESMLEYEVENAMRWIHFCQQSYHHPFTRDWDATVAPYSEENDDIVPFRDYDNDLFLEKHVGAKPGKKRGAKKAKAYMHKNRFF